MQKKSKIIISLSLLIIIFLIIGLTIYYKSVNKSLINKKIYGQSKEIQKAFKEYDVVECKFDLINPKYVFVSFQHYIYPDDNIDMKSLDVDFYNLSRPHIFSTSWTTQYTGGTTVKNTTFPELVEMVKEDCSQFQENFDAEDPETQIDWGYREAEPPKTQEELKKEKEEEYYSMYNQYIDFSDEVKNLIRERYGDWENTEYDELLELSLQVAEDEEIGRMANPQWYEMMDQMDEDEEL